MLPAKVFFFVRVMFCLAVVSASEAKRKKSGRRNREPEEPPSYENMCDIQSPEVIYCYCDALTVDQAEEANCWIFNDTSEKQDGSSIWDGFWTQKKIKNLTLHLRPDGTLKAVPTRAINFLPEIALFEVQYGTIERIHPFSFGNSTSLERLSLTRNSIKALETNAFASLPLLDRLTLGENHITEVNRGVFTSLPKLTKLYMDRNNITVIEDKAFEELHNLIELELFSNQIQAVVPETFKGLRSLQRLDLHKNRIEVIGDMTFQSLKSLLVLDLKENSVKYIAPKSFYGLSKLQKLVLQDNKLLSLGTDIFQYTGNLYYLDIRNNVLETILLETVTPILDNLRNQQMTFYSEGNSFRCDDRLLWMFELHNATQSKIVRMNLEEALCYWQGYNLPARFQVENPTTGYNAATLGIGPHIRLLDIQPSELNPLEASVKSYSCEQYTGGNWGAKEKTGGGGGRGRSGRGRGRKNRLPNRDKTAQNDMAPVAPQVEKSTKAAADPQPESEVQVESESQPELQPPAPVQESREAYSDNKNGKICSSTLLSMVCAVVILVIGDDIH